MSTAHGNWLTRVAAAVAVATAVWLAGCASTPGPKSPATPQYAVPKASGFKPQREEPKSSSGSWWTPEEPKKPTNVPEWMSSGKRMDP